MGDEDDLEDEGRRKEVFNIAEDEQLIGCELDQNEWHCFQGVTWIKMKVLEF